MPDRQAQGHTVIGSAGGADKCAFVKHIGADHVIDYKATGDLTRALLHVAPKGIDVYFENVGGEHLEAALAAANRLLALLSPDDLAYNTIGLPSGPRNIMFVMGKSLRLEGSTSRTISISCPIPERDVHMDTRRQDHMEGNHRPRHRERARSLSQIV